MNHRDLGLFAIFLLWPSLTAQAADPLVARKPLTQYVEMLQSDDEAMRQTASDAICYDLCKAFGWSALALYPPDAKFQVRASFRDEAQALAPVSDGDR